MKYEAPDVPYSAASFSVRS